ncbi:MAG: hypothetical protein WD492_11340 [Alkalispirochaeta sp.]
MRAISARLFLAGLIVATSACSSSPEPTTSLSAPDTAGELSLVRDLRPENGVPVFLGVANRKRNREDEEAVAVQHIAQQASRYLRTSAIYQHVSQRGSQGVGYLDDITTHWDEKLAAELTESVDILTSTRTDTGTLVTARVTSLPAAPDVHHIDPGGTAGPAPAWVAGTPEVPGYLVAVGTAQQRRTLRDTIDFTDQEALKAILIQRGSTLRMVEDRRSVESRGTIGSVTRAEEAQATLSGFLVVARYATSDGRYHYSLAIAREE